jgi:hypothetical protein
MDRPTLQYEPTAVQPKRAHTAEDVFLLVAACILGSILSCIMGIGLFVVDQVDASYAVVWSVPVLFICIPGFALSIGIRRAIHSLRWLGTYAMIANSLPLLLMLSATLKAYFV